MATLAALVAMAHMQVDVALCAQETALIMMALQLAEDAQQAYTMEVQQVDAPTHHRLVVAAEVAVTPHQEVAVAATLHQQVALGAVAASRAVVAAVAASRVVAMAAVAASQAAMAAAEVAVAVEEATAVVDN